MIDVVVVSNSNKPEKKFRNFNGIGTHDHYIYSKQA